MTSSDTRITVLVPTYEPGPEVRAAVESVLTQGDVTVDVTILDDGSRVGPERHLREILDDPRVAVRRSSVNRGAAATWNDLFASATAPYVKLLPQDDLLAPGCLRSQLDALRGSDAVVAAGRRRLLTRKGRRFGPALGLSGLEGLRTRQEVIDATARSGGNPVGEPGSWLIDREAATTVRFRKEAGYAVDLAYLLDLLARGPLVGIPSVHTYFRVSNTAWTSRLAREQVNDVVRLLDEVRHGDTDDASARRIGRTIRRRSLARRAIYLVLGGSRPEGSRPTDGSRPGSIR